MHPQSPPYGGTVLKESIDLVILKVTFDSKMTYEMHLRSVSKAASQRVGILEKSGRVFHDRSLLGRCFRGFVLPVLEFNSAVWCSAAHTHFKLLHSAVGGAWFRTGGVFECDIAHRRSVAVLCMQYKIRCNPAHHLNGRVTRRALVVHRYTHALRRCRISQCSRIFILLLVSLWNDPANPIFDGVGLVGFKSWANAFLLT